MGDGHPGTVPSPLLTTDASALRASVRPRSQGRLIRWSIPLAVAVVIAVHTAAAPAPACTDAAPCGPDPVDALAVCVLFAAAVAGPIDAVVATWLSALFLGLLIVSERIVGAPAVSPLWTYLVDLALVLLCTAVARLGRWRATAPLVAWSAAVARSPVPRDVAELMSAQPPAARPRRWFGAALIGAAVVCCGLTVAAQLRGEERQRGADTVTGEVVGHSDDGAIRVRIGGREATIPVWVQSEHPIGQRLLVTIDDEDGVGLVSEPYDATPWLLPAFMMAGAGWALRRSGRIVASDRREFLETAQPCTIVYVRMIPGEETAIYASDAREGEAAVGVIDGTLWHRPVGSAATVAVGPAESSEDAEDTEDAEEAWALAPTVPGVLYGTPVPGAWCLVEADGAVTVPSRPLRRAIDAWPFTAPLLTPSEEEIFEPAVSREPVLDADEIGRIPLDDRLPDAGTVLTHRLGVLPALVLTFVSPLAWLWFVVRWVPPSYIWWVPLSVVVTAVSFVVFLRYALSIRLAWNRTGLVFAAHGVEPVTLAWREVDRIERRGWRVTIHSGSQMLRVLALPLPAWISGARSGEALVRALRYAREHGPTLSSFGPPQPPAAASWAGLAPLLFAVYVPALAWVMKSLAAWV